MLETTIVSKIKARAKALGFWVLKTHGGPFQMQGLPDLLCIKNGIAVWLEVKRPGGKATLLQVKRKEELERVAGCRSEIVFSVEEAESVLRGSELNKSGAA